MRTPSPWNPPAEPFSLAQVAHLGVTERRLAVALRHGHIVRLRRGVYIKASALPEDPVSTHLLHAQAGQVMASGRVASHHTAALAHGLPLRWTSSAAADPAAFTVAREASGYRRSHNLTGVRRAALPDHHVQRLPSGLEVTTPARTAVDLASDLPLPEALMVVDATLRQELAGLMGRLERQHYRNPRLIEAAQRPLREAAGYLRLGQRRKVAEVLALADIGHESPLESFSAGRFHLAGLPAPLKQARVITPVGTLYPDFCWECWRVIGEADGEGKYANASAFAREKEREQLLREDGWTVVRWTGREGFITPDVVDQRVAQALTAAGWRPDAIS